MDRRHLAIVLTISGLILGAFTLPSYGQQPQSCQIGNTVILAVNSAHLGGNAVVTSGDIVVNKASSGPMLVPGFSLSIDKPASIAGSIAADRIKLSQQVTISGITSFNQLTNDGATLGGQSTPLALPVFGALPTFQEARLPGTAQNVAVAAGTTQVLAAGEYGDVVIDTAGQVIFSGGVYSIRSINATGQNT